VAAVGTAGVVGVGAAAAVGLAFPFVGPLVLAHLALNDNKRHKRETGEDAADMSE
jgi:hypothetical protein